MCGDGLADTGRRPILKKSPSFSADDDEESSVEGLFFFFFWMSGGMFGGKMQMSGNVQ